MLKAMTSGLKKELSARNPWRMQELDVAGEAANYVFVVTGTAESDYKRGDVIHARDEVERVQSVLEETGLDKLYQVDWPPALTVRSQVKDVEQVFPPRSGSFATFRYRNKILGLI